MPVEIEIKAGGGATVERLMAVLNGVPDLIAKELTIAVNETARKHERQIQERIASLIVLDRKGREEATWKTHASPTSVQAQVGVYGIKRMSLKRFNAKQVRKGVSYKIRKDGGRRLAEGAFGPDIAKLGNHVFKRIGKARFPLRKLRGPSPGAVYLRNKSLPWSEQEVEKRLVFEVERRIKAVLYKAANQIK